MKGSIIRTLIFKDISLFLRDKFFSLMAILGLILYILFYFFMPKSVDETIKIAVYTPTVSSFFVQNLETDGVIVQQMESEDELRQAVTDKKYPVGIAIPDDLPATFLAGETPKITVYTSSDLPNDMKELYALFLNEMISTKSTEEINIEIDEIILGPDMGGKQVPIRDRLLPLFVFILLLTETMGLANLITSELESRTVQALLTTPMNVTDLFVGKGITGVLLAFSQAVFLMIITGTLVQQTLLILVALLLGSIMVTGLAFFIASISKDMMSVVAWGVLFMIVLIIPSLLIILPGTLSDWIKAVPSYYFVETIHKAVNFNVGWSGNSSNLLFLTGFNFAIIFVGIASLKRKLL